MSERWVACVSQTGRELYEICEKRLVKPDVLLTTSPDYLIQEIWDLEIPEVVVIPRRPTIDQFFQIFLGADVITLHGFLYIIPEVICKAYEGKIFNGHPGAIHRYAELKGKDPQVRAYGKYEYYGTVIHEVTAEVDDGKLLDQDEIEAIYISSLDKLFKTLRMMSINLWIRFFNRRENEAGIGRSSWNREDDAS